MRLVIDCNVVISAGLTSYGTCQQAISKAFKDYEVIVTDAILQEYKNVAGRNKFLKVNHILFHMIKIIESSATKVNDRHLDGIILPDNDDLIYICACLNSKSKYLITGNVKDFPNKYYHNTEILLPKEFLNNA